MARTASHFSSAREFRVSFADRLADAVVVAENAPLPPLRRPTPPTPVEHTAGLCDTPLNIPTPAPRVPAAPPAPPTDLLVTEIGAQLSADRRAIEAVLGSVTAAVDGLKQEHAERLFQWRAAAVELAVSIAAKLLHERIAADQFNLEQMIRDMAADLNDEVVCVRLNPHDLELLEKRLDGQPLLSGPTDPQLIADTSLARGECRVEGRSAVSLSDLPRQLGQIREDLLRRVADARA